MRHFLKVPLLFLLCFSFLLVGCTRQKKIDLAEFCKCFNTIEKSEVLSSATFLRTEEEENPCYHMAVPLSGNASAFLSLESEPGGALKGLQLTLLSADSENPEEALGALFDFFKTATAVLENKAPDALETTFQSIGLQKDSIQFSPFYLKETEERVTYTVICRAEGVALFCELL